MKPYNSLGRFKRKWIVLILLVIIFIPLVNLYYKNEIYEPFTNGAVKPIPKHIWTYWSDNGNEKESRFVERCIESWKHFNPAYEITVLNKTNYREYVDLDISTIKHSTDSEARFSDYLRLLLLAKYGGFWMDASIICQKPLDWIIELQQQKGAELFGYLVPNDSPENKVIESWFLACAPDSPFVRDWCAEFLRTREFASIDEYLNDLHEKKVDLTYIDKGLQNYLAIHCANQAVMHFKSSVNSSVNYKLVLLSSTKNKGPFAASSDSGFGEDAKTVDTICKGNYRDVPILKMRGGERKAASVLPDFECMFNEKPRAKRQ